MKVNPKGREGGWMDGKEGKKMERPSSDPDNPLSLSASVCFSFKRPVYIS